MFLYGWLFLLTGVQVEARAKLVADAQRAAEVCAVLNNLARAAVLMYLHATLFWSSSADHRRRHV